MQVMGHGTHKQGCTASVSTHLELWYSLLYAVGHPQEQLLGVITEDSVTCRA